MPILILFSCYWHTSPNAYNVTTATTNSTEENDPCFLNQTFPAANIGDIQNYSLHNFNWTTNSGDEALKLLEEYGVFYTLESAMKIFKSKYCRTNNHVTKLLDSFHSRCPNIADDVEEIPVQERAPFIAIECIHTKTRTIVTQKLSHKVRGSILFSPPTFMRMGGMKFNRTHLMRRSFFTMGNYATGYMARTNPVRIPLITSGYWLDQAVYRVARTFGNNLPPENSPVYNWPNNLHRPDLHFFLNYRPIKPITEQDKMDGKYLMTEAYRRWHGANLIEINSTIIYLDIVSIMINHINKVLSTTYARPRNIASFF